jgi:hypothetical protein
MACLRGKCDGGANAASARCLRQVIRICARAWCATKWILLHVTKAAVAELFLLTFSLTKAGVSDKHTKALWQALV